MMYRRQLLIVRNPWGLKASKLLMGPMANSGLLVNQHAQESQADTTVNEKRLDSDGDMLMLIYRVLKGKTTN